MTNCPDCFHESHPLRRCPEIVGSSGASTPDPVYCECADARAMETEIRRLTAAAPREAGLREALADAIALAGMLTDNLEGRGLLPYYVNIARTTLPKLRAALATEGKPTAPHVHDWSPPPQRGDHDYGIGPTGWWCPGCGAQRDTGKVWPAPAPAADGSAAEGQGQP